jgi:hypothetical protein
MVMTIGIRGNSSLPTIAIEVRQASPTIEALGVRQASLHRVSFWMTTIYSYLGGVKW